MGHQIFFWLCEINDCNVTMSKLCFNAISHHKTTSNIFSSGRESQFTLSTQKAYFLLSIYTAHDDPLSACTECPQIIREAAARCGPNWVIYLIKYPPAWAFVWCTFSVHFMCFVFCFLFCLCDQDFVQFRGDHLDLKIGATKVICNNDKENDINSRAGYHQVTIFCPR